jgi:predicted PhzF superfamily epimerase YddE/YHI9
MGAPPLPVGLRRSGRCRDAMAVPIFVVDAFAARAFTGNPAGVCLLGRPAPAAWMQRVAAEMKHAETSFLWPTHDGFRLRWFTPTAEVALCGHATLAAAHILWETGALARRTPARFHTKSGVLTAVQRPPSIELDFPADRCAEVRPPPAMTAAIPPPYHFVGKGQFDFLVELDSPRRLRTVRPDLEALEALGGRGVIVTSRSDTRGFDFLVRFFAPNFGVPEDPATGSIQCLLGPYWAARLGKRSVRSFQASPRGAVLEAEPVGDRVRIRGRAVTVLVGSLRQGPG